MRGKIFRRTVIAGAMLLLAGGVLHGCATAPADDPEVTARAATIMKSCISLEGAE